jgi:hypothetical protein
MTASYKYIQNLVKTKFRQINAKICMNARSSCIKTQQQAEFNRQMGVTDRQITAYCVCYSSYLARVIEMEELRYFARNGRMPESLTHKMPGAYQSCSQAALGR